MGLSTTIIIMGLCTPISINETLHDETEHNSFNCIECRYAECHVFIVMLGAVMLSVVVVVPLCRYTECRGANYFQYEYKFIFVKCN